MAILQFFFFFELVLLVLSVLINSIESIETWYQQALLSSAFSHGLVFVSIHVEIMCTVSVYCSITKCNSQKSKEVCITSAIIKQ